MRPILHEPDVPIVLSPTVLETVEDCANGESLSQPVDRIFRL